MTDSTQTTVVFEAADPTEVNMAKGLLEGAGIPVVEKARGGAGVLSVLAGPLSQGLRTLAVPAELEKRALELLREAMGDGSPPEEAPPKDG